MTISFPWIMAALAIGAMILFWLFKTSRDVSNTLIVLVGCVVVIVLALNWDSAVGPFLLQMLHIPTTYAAPAIGTPTPVSVGGQ